MKSFRCYVNDIDLKHTLTGKRKIWRTDNKITFCCSFTPSLFIWERATQFNNYEPYTGYVNPEIVELI